MGVLFVGVPRSGSAQYGPLGYIEKVSAIVGSIAAAVEQQGAATAEIARNVQQTVQAAQDVSVGIKGVSQASGETGSAAGQLLTVASAVSKQAGQLSDQVTSFLAGVRAARFRGERRLAARSHPTRRCLVRGKTAATCGAISTTCSGDRPTSDERAMKAIAGKAEPGACTSS